MGNSVMRSGKRRENNGSRSWDGMRFENWDSEKVVVSF